MAGPTRIERSVMVHGGKCRASSPWVVNNSFVTNVDGVEMVALSKTDTGFSRFVSGSTTGIGSMTFLEELRKMRTQASFEANNDGLFNTMHMNPKAKKAQKEQLKNAGMPNMVQVTLPAMEDFPSMKVKVQSNLEIRENVWVELKVDVLNHIAACMRDSVQDEPASRVRVGRGVRWSSQRNGFIATRANKRMKTFRHDQDASDEDLAKEAAKEAAMAWAAKAEETEAEAEADGDA